MPLEFLESKEAESFTARSTDDPTILFYLKQVEGDNDLMDKEIYQHYRNLKYYQICGIALNTVTNCRYVIYKALYDDTQFGNNCIWARKYDEFVGKVDGTPQLRFIKQSSETKVE
jgi:hypothetical protein